MTLLFNASDSFWLNLVRNPGPTGLLGDLRF